MNGQDGNIEHRTSNAEHPIGFPLEPWAPPHPDPLLHFAEEREQSARAARPAPRWVYLLLTGWLVVAGLSAVAADVFYMNPVLPGDHPDPSIIRVGKDFWATSTSSEWGPQFLIQHSTDLVNWEAVAPVFPHRPAWAVANFWAPEISEYKGRYYVYYVGRERGGALGVAVATSDNPGGPYTDHGPIVAQADGSIDPAPATDENGVRYLIWKEDGNSRHAPTPIWAQPLNEDGTKLTGQPTELIHNDADWEGGVVEGPFILRRGDWFYLFYAGNGCCGTRCHYAVGVARSHKLLGPWEKDPSNPIAAANQTWECPGHGSIVSDGQGRYWFLYHAYPAEGTVFTGREGMLDEVKFGDDGWPTINDGKGPSVRALSPFGAPQRKSDAHFSDDFSEAALRPDWQWPQDREPNYRVGTGQLVLRANGDTNLLSAVVARAVTTEDYVATVVVENGQLKPGWVAGLWAYGDDENDVGVALSRDSGVLLRREKGLWRQLGSNQKVTGAKVHLRLTARHGWQFQFSMSDDGKAWTALDKESTAKDLPPWDRSVRVALTAGGAAEAESRFEAFSMEAVVQ